MASTLQMDVRSLRSTQLQVELKKRGLSSSGKKSELRRRLDEALTKERNAVTANSDGKSTARVEAVVVNKMDTSNKTGSAEDKVDTTASHNMERTADKGGNADASTSTAQEAPAPAVVQEKSTEPVEEGMESKEETSKDISVDKATNEPTADSVPSHDESALEPGECERSTTEETPAEVSMEMDELVVHTVDEDDFKIEAQSRGRVSKKSGELPSSTTDEQGEVDSPSTKKRKINLQGSLAGTPTSSSSERKRKWKSSSSKSSATTISSDVLKKIIPDSVAKEVTSDTVDDVFPDSSTASHDSLAKTEKSTDIVTTATAYSVSDTAAGDAGDQQRLRLAEEETRRRIEIRLREKQDGEQRQHPQMQQPLRSSEVSESDLTANKEVIVDYNQAVRVRSPLTNRNPPSCVLHIANLVRPFAQSQLRELLTEDGMLVNNGFWINKIKSHCFAVYESIDAAIATRNRLDGVKWPVTNPKVLGVDFSNDSEVLKETDGALAITSCMVTDGNSITVKEVAKETPVVEEKKPLDAVAKEEVVQVEQTTKQDGEVQEAERKPSESAVNRLDELFKKTISTPQIYWLPLTTEEGEKRLAAIKADEELRRQRREQRQKEREEKEKLEQEEREKRRKSREEEREKRKKQRSNSKQRSRSRSRHRSHSREKQRSRSRSRHRSQSREKQRSRSRSRHRSQSRDRHHR